MLAVHCASFSGLVGPPAFLDLVYEGSSSSFCTHIDAPSPCAVCNCFLSCSCIDMEKTRTSTPLSQARGCHSGGVHVPYSSGSLQGDICRTQCRI